MNEKLSFQNIADALVQKTGVSKKVAETFAKAFFDTLMEALCGGEESIKVKGLGTFKLVKVESRESVNVSNGERIVIPGYKKISFTPEESVVDFLNRKEELETEDEVEKIEETEVEEENVVEEVSKEVNEELMEENVEVEEDTIEKLIQVPEPEKVELPQDEFAGIDMLISTPESIDEIRQQYEDAKKKMDVAVDEARKAHLEKMRLEKLLERLEAHVVPENMEETVAEEVVAATPEIESVVEESPAAEGTSTLGASVPQMLGQEKHHEAMDRLMQERPEEEKSHRKRRRKKKSSKKHWTAIVVSLLLAAIMFFLYRTFVSIESVEQVPVVVVEQPVRPAKPTSNVKKETKKKVEQKKDTLKAVAQNPDSIVTKDVQNIQKDSVKTAVKPVEEPKPTRPTTHRMQRGESLTRISLKYYGTRDSVRAIIRINSFRNPDNVPVGAVVKLP